MTENKTVYIASPYAGDIETNIVFAKCKWGYADDDDGKPV